MSGERDRTPGGDALPDLPNRRVRVPVVLQIEPVECGAACLAMVLAHHGQHVPLDRLRVECGVSRDGSNAMNIILAARERGLDAAGYRMDLSGFAETALPFIVFWEYNHFVVVEGFSHDRVHIVDPSFGRRTIDLASAASSYSGVVLDFQPTPQFKRQGRPPRSFSRLPSIFRGSEHILLQSVWACVAAAVPILVGAAIVRLVVDAGVPQGDVTSVLPLAIILAVAGAARAALIGIQWFCLHRIALKLTVVDTGRCLWHALRLPPDFYQRRSPGDVAWRVGEHEDTANELTMSLVSSASALLGALLCALVMLLIHPGLGIALLAIGVLGAALPQWRGSDLWQRVAIRSARVRALEIGVLRSLESIKACAREPDVLARLLGLHTASVQSTQRLEERLALSRAFSMLLTGAGSALIVWWGGAMAQRGELSAGSLAVVLVLFWTIQTAIAQSATIFDSIARLTQRWRSIEDVMDAPPQFSGAVASNTIQENISVRRLSGFLELRGVSFGYNRREPPLIENFSLSISPGERVAIVGPSGSGKSTIARLVCGLVDPWSGDVFFDGHARTEHRRSRMANSVSLAQRESFLFEGTIRENISLWDRTLRDDAIQRAAKDAMIYDVITARRGAFAARVEAEGRNFSGGQRQRLEIARALAVDPTILILDEATGMLDARTESEIDDNIRRRGCACLIIAHRIQTIQDCSEIIVLDCGRIVARGTHQQLLSECDLYRHLAQQEGAA